MINLRFLTRLGLRSMVSLLPGPPAPHLIAWCEEHAWHSQPFRVRQDSRYRFSKDVVRMTARTWCAPDGMGGAPLLFKTGYG